MHSSFRLFWSGIVCTSLLFAACSGMAPEELSLVAEIQAQEAQTDEAAQSTEAAPLASTGDESSSVQVAGDVVAPALPAIVLGRAELRASDPNTFVLASGKVQLVEFMAYWCAVCKAMAPTVHGLEDLYGDKINFVYLDRDDPATFAFQQQLGYIYQPHFFLLGADGSVIGQWRGYVDGVVLQEALVAAISE